MSIPGLEEVNKVAKEFIRLRNKARRTKDKKDIAVFNSYQNYTTTKLAHLVMMKANRYKKFSNFPDLAQDGFEALLLALKTYKPSKGDFSWWARKYIDTRISRAANAHSTIRYPLKKAKQFPPYKINELPIIIDTKATPFEILEHGELSSIIMTAINLLPERQKEVIMLCFDFNGKSRSSISKISKEMDLSRSTCVKLLDEAKKNLKINLLTVIDGSND